MILEALVRHYDRLADDGHDELPVYGFARKKITHVIVLEHDGTIHSINQLNPGQDRGIQLTVPDYGEKRTVNNRPYFCWDNAEYIFGTPIETKHEGRAQKRHDLFVQLHREVTDKISIPLFSALLHMLSRVEPGQAKLRNDWEDICTGTFVFTMRDENFYLHDHEQVKSSWLYLLNEKKESQRGFCLISGRPTGIAKLHGAIKGVRDPGGQAEKGIIAFNSTENPAFDSFSKTQSYNAPVSLEASFKYTTALNTLLADDRHKVQLGDTTVVFWTEKSPSLETESPDPADALAEAFGIYKDKDDSEPKQPGATQTRSALQDFLERYRQGKSSNDAELLENAASPFYVLGLAPNAARISVRFWLSCTVAELAQRLDRHIQSLEMTGSRTDQSSPTLRQLVRETARETKDIPPQLAGELARAVLTGNPYPHSYPVAILRRIVADHVINHPRAAGLKAWLTRNHNREVSVSLDPQRTEEAYLLGRLFAAYERIQTDSVDGKLNRTIRDSYLSSASATPGIVFPRLYKLSQHHLGKLRRDKPGLAVVRERLVGEICRNLERFPTRLTLEHQGLFAIGYYHQTQDFYTRHDDSQTDTSSEEA